MNKLIKIALMAIGIILIADGIGSIYVYQTQPWWPDHSVRIFRSFIGCIITYIGWRF